MPRNKSSFRIKERPGEPGVFECESWTLSKMPYTVDLFENRGNGVCTCTDFQTRCFPNWKENGGKIVDYGVRGRPDPKRTYCKHIKLVRFHFLNKLLDKLYWQRRHTEH